MAIIEKASATLEERVGYGRVPSADIRSAFDAVYTKIPTKKTIYWLVEEETDFRPRQLRRIIEEKVKSGPRAVHDFLIELGIKFDDVDIITSTTALIDWTIENGVFRDKMAVTHFLLEKLRPKFPKLKEVTLRNSLFYSRHQHVSPLDYSVHEILIQVKEGTLTVESKYQANLRIYRELLKRTFRILNNWYGMHQAKFEAFMGSMLGIPPATVHSHLYNKKIGKGAAPEGRNYFDKLLEYLVKEPLYMIDLTDISRLEEKLERFHEARKSNPKKDKVVVLLNKYHSDTTLRFIVAYIKADSRTYNYHVAFAFDRQGIAQAILSLPLPSQTTPYTTSPANHS